MINKNRNDILFKLDGNVSLNENLHKFNLKIKYKTIKNNY